jgi:transcriptional regulator with XRE-family HTH domain
MSQGFKDLISNISELLQERGWSQRKLAEYTGLTPGAISYYLNGKTAPQLDAMLKIANAFGVPVSRLLLGKGDQVDTITKTIRVQATPLEALEMIRKELLFAAQIPPEARAAVSRMSASDWKKLSTKKR